MVFLVAPIGSGGTLCFYFVSASLKNYFVGVVCSVVNGSLSH